MEITNEFNLEERVLERGVFEASSSMNAFAETALSLFYNQPPCYQVTGSNWAMLEKQRERGSLGNISPK